MTVSDGGAVNTSDRFMALVARVERFYLSLLRIILLLLASGLVIGALWSGISGLYQVSRSTAAVVEAPTTVTAAEIADIPTRAGDENSNDAKIDPLQTQREFYRRFIDSYFYLYRNKFAKFRQADDPVIDRAAFDTRYVQSGERLDSIGRGDLNFTEDKVQLDLLLSKMREVSSLPQTLDRLNRYRAAKKIQTSKVVRSTRSERYCSYFGYYINQCISYDTREVPYTRTIVETHLPPGVMAPSDLFQAYQDHHFELLTSRHRDNASKADTERANIAAGNVDGAARLWRGLVLGGGFLAVMFLFLVIAIERHQRKLVARVEDAALFNHQMRPAT